MPFTKEQSKEEISKLIEKYERIQAEGKIKQYNEEMTKKDFILPLFEALGWDVYNKKSDEVTAEEKASKGRVDYAFRINGIPKLFVEAKALKVDLDQPKWAQQAINYAWHKSVFWAVLTDFEGIKVFNAEVKSKYPLQGMLFSLSYRQYLERFDQLWLLSRESLEKGLLDKEAEKWGKKLRKVPVDKQLLDDFTRWRELLSKDILKLNLDKHLTEEELDESVQRILDRLIFIRSCEDRELEEKVLISDLREWADRGRGALVKKLRERFVYFDDRYDSELFRKHLCDDLEINNEVLKDIISGLYRTKDMVIVYDFSAIDADVLGTIYEQYLGHLLKKTPKRAKLEAKKAHRKEHGIYYTPTYIVDYIVRNTLGELLKDKKVDAENIKILDPACGSGSFLIKSFDVLNEYWAKKNKYDQTELDTETGASTPFTRKVKILKNNIFGVDLDSKAVEIARLNLLLKIAERKQRLPLLQESIKCGNSLIDDPDVAGDKAFKWKKEFSEIMKEGGFDVVVGNPPYGAEFSNTEKDFLKSKYSEDQTRNSASFFILKGLELVKENGYFAYIVPKQLTYISSWQYIRKELLNTNLVRIIDVSEAFQDVELEQVVFITKKEKISDRVIVGFSNNGKIEQSNSNRKYFSNERLPLWVNDENYSIFNKILSNSTPLCELAEVNWGGHVARYLSKTKTSDSIPCVRGREISRYGVSLEYFIKTKDIVPSYHVKGEKLLFQRIVSRCGSRIIANYRDARIVGTYCNDDFYADKTVTLLWNSSISLKYLLGLLNSKLISWFAHRYLWNRSQLTMEFMYSYAREFPILASLNENQKNRIENLVDTLLSLHKRLNELKDKKTDERWKIEEEIKKTDAEIDQMVYKLYGLTEGEIKVIEEASA